MQGDPRRGVPGGAAQFLPGARELGADQHRRPAGLAQGGAGLAAWCGRRPGSPGGLAGAAARVRLVDSAAAGRRLGASPPATRRLLDRRQPGAGGVRRRHGRRSLVARRRGGRLVGARATGAVRARTRLLLGGHEGRAGQVHPEITPRPSRRPGRDARRARGAGTERMAVRPRGRPGPRVLCAVAADRRRAVGRRRAAVLSGRGVRR